MHHSPVGVSPDGAVAIIRSGGVLIFPTETFFGLGGLALYADATAKVFRVKRRSSVQPLPIVAANEEQLDMVCRMPPGFAQLVRPFWPGALSAVLPARLRVPDMLTGGTGKVAVRISSHPVCQGLALALGEPITASSANISGRPPVTDAAGLDPELVDGVDGVFDAPPRPGGGLPSTLIEPCDDGAPYRIRLLRDGAVSRQVLEQAGFLVVPHREST